MATIKDMLQQNFNTPAWQHRVATWLTHQGMTTPDRKALAEQFKQRIVQGFATLDHVVMLTAWSPAHNEDVERVVTQAQADGPVTHLKVPDVFQHEIAASIPVPKDLPIAESAVHYWTESDGKGSLEYTAHLDFALQPTAKPFGVLQVTGTDQSQVNGLVMTAVTAKVTQLTDAGWHAIGDWLKEQGLIVHYLERERVPKHVIGLMLSIGDC